jgi:SAM-dependent methyltransferase
MKRRMAGLWQRFSPGLGLDPRRLATSLRALPWFWSTLEEYRRSEPADFPLDLGALYPCLLDRHADSGAYDRHYFHQDLWAARKIHAARPARHVDVGSRLDGFVAHLLTFMPVTVIDVRPLSSRVSGLSFQQADATDMAPFADGSIASLSCLHALEHFGLGRYGDPVEPSAWARALGSFSRVLAPGGRLYLSLPVGRQRLEFNAHRVFAPETILQASRGLELLSFSAVNDAGDFAEDAEPSAYDGARYACGMFELAKR